MGVACGWRLGSARARPVPLSRALGANPRQRRRIHLFCGPRQSTRYVSGERVWAGSRTTELATAGSFELDNWSFLSLLADVEVVPDLGTERVRRCCRRAPR